MLCNRMSTQQQLQIVRHIASFCSIKWLPNLLPMRNFQNWSKHGRMHTLFFKNLVECSQLHPHIPQWPCVIMLWLQPFKKWRPFCRMAFMPNSKLLLTILVLLFRLMQWEDMVSMTKFILLLMLTWRNSFYFFVWGNATDADIHFTYAEQKLEKVY